MTEVTRILKQIEDGNLLASEQLLPLVYDEIRQLAACANPPDAKWVPAH